METPSQALPNAQPHEQTSPLPSSPNKLCDASQVVQEHAKEIQNLDGEQHIENIQNPAKAEGEKDEAEAENPEENFYATGWRLLFILTSLLLCIFCQALDDTIIATAIPRITDHFHRLNDVGWYGSSYLLTNAAFQLFFGKLYQLLPLRWVFLAALATFELGSLIAAVSPTSNTLIAGRAVAGVGAAGITSGALTIMAHVTPLHRRPLFVSLIGGVYGIASVSGPIMGGALAQNVTWRWNFYINLPIGGTAALALLLSLDRLPPSAQGQRLPVLKMLKRLDPVGTLTFVPSIICLLLALQWGGIEYAWSTGRLIALLTVFVVLLVISILSQVLQSQENTTVPVHMMKNRSMTFGAWFAFCQGAAFNLYVFYIPLYFQGVQNASPIRSGVDYLPLILINTVGILLSGFLTTKIGYYMPWIWTSSVLMSVGAGLLTLLRVDSNTSRWVGYQILFAIGSGFGLQQPFLTAQAVLPLEEISTGSAFMLWAQLGGAAIFVSVAQNVFTNHLVRGVTDLSIPGLDARLLVNLGATQFRQIVPAGDLGRVLEAYDGALVKAYQVGLIMACLSVIGPAGMKWVNVKQKPKADKETAQGT